MVIAGIDFATHFQGGLFSTLLALSSFVAWYFAIRLLAPLWRRMTRPRRRVWIRRMVVGTAVPIAVVCGSFPMKVATREDSSTFVIHEAYGLMLWIEYRQPFPAGAAVPKGPQTGPHVLPVGVFAFVPTLLALTLMGAVIVRQAPNWYRLMPDHRCDHCGYDLRGTLGEVCSECGASILPTGGESPIVAENNVMNVR